MSVDHTHTIIELRGISFGYNAQTPVIRDISLDIHQGDYLGIIGPNGGGKTTLLKLMLGLIQPASGSIKLFGQDISQFSDWATIGYVPQKVVNFDAHFPATVEEVVSMGRYDAGYDYLGLFKFAMPKLPAGVQVTVRSASLELYYTDNSRNASQSITPYEATADWNEDTVTWASRPALSSTAAGSALLFPNRNSINQWQVLALDPAVVQKWVQDATTARGLALVGTGTPGMTSLEVASSEAFTNAAQDLRPRLVLRLALTNTDPTPPVINGLQAVNVGELSATIQWTTNENADGLVEYGATTTYGQSSPQQTALSTSHAVPLTGLTSRTPYHARVMSRDAAGNAATSQDLAFTTTGPIAGDLNRDGQVTMGDIPLLVGQLLGTIPATPETADVNQDGRISLADLQALVSRL